LGRKERYVLAMALLLVIGLSAAWAAGSSMATISFPSVSDFPSVTANKPSISLSNLKRNVWFYNVTKEVFTINVPTESKLWVRVGVQNMAQLADDFKALDINVTLRKSGGTKVDSDVISLGAGTSSVLLNLAASTSTGGTYCIDLYISGRPTITLPDPIMLYCVIEPAEGVVQKPSS
jgi:hypothetical protein